MDLQKQYEDENNTRIKNADDWKDYAYWLEERLKQSSETGQVDVIVSSTVDFEDFKRTVLLLQRSYCAIEPKQDWGDDRIVDYKPFISEANKFVNDIRHKYKF